MGCDECEIYLCFFLSHKNIDNWSVACFVFEQDSSSCSSDSDKENKKDKKDKKKEKVNTCKMLISSDYGSCYVEMSESHWSFCGISGFRLIS